MPLEQVNRECALTKSQFHRLLRSWLENTDDAIVGPDDIPGVTTWIYIRDDAALFGLHADVKREAVRRYLELVAVHGDDLQWQVATSDRGKLTAVVYGPKKVRCTPFYLYAAKTAA